MIQSQLSHMCSLQEESPETTYLQSPVVVFLNAHATPAADCTHDCVDLGSLGCAGGCCQATGAESSGLGSPCKGVTDLLVTEMDGMDDRITW